MGINVGLANSQANSIRQYSSVLRDIMINLKQQKASLNYAWQGTEMQHVNRSLDQLIQQMGSLSSEIDSICGDIISVASEIRREEEAREAAARAAAERAAAERAAALRSAASNFLWK